jgi:hypothetical protein
MYSSIHYCMYLTVYTIFYLFIQVCLKFVGKQGNHPHTPLLLSCVLPSFKSTGAVQQLNFLS